MNMPMAMMTRQPSMVGRRPIRSATPPSRIEPNAMPISSIDSTMPSAARLMPHSAAMPGEAKLIDITSKPSSALSAIVSATTAHCRRLIDWLAMMSLGSVVVMLCFRLAPPGWTARRQRIITERLSSGEKRLRHTKTGRTAGQSTTIGDSAARLNCVPEPGQNRKTSMRVRAGLIRLELRLGDETRSGAHRRRHPYGIGRRPSPLPEADQDELMSLRSRA